MNAIDVKKRKTIALTWWSTWWHIFPLLSIYNYLKEENNFDYLWVWEENSLEEEIALENNIDFLDIPAWKIRRYFDLKNFYEPLKNITWIFFWIYYILTNKIDIVFSKWGYVALPLCIAAFILRKDIYIHESDTVSGISNKIISKIATKIFYTFPNEETNNPENTKCLLSWQILNPELLDDITSLEINENNKLSVVVLWGSQWSTKIFNWLIKILPDFNDVDFQVILWEKNTHFKPKFKEFPNVKTYDFLSQKALWKVLKDADLAITRWWATSLWELYAFWVKSIIVPLTNSAWDHQKNNSIYFNQAFWSQVVDENHEFEISLYRKIKKNKTYRKKELNLQWFFKPLQTIEKQINETV